MKTIFTGLDRDISENLKQQLSVLWTHSSNAIEGSSLTLGETDFVIREGITISGKPLKDFKDAESHYKAISEIYRLADTAASLTEDTLFLLHRAIMPDAVLDRYKPFGAWKKEPNGTYHFDDQEKKSIWFEYPSPEKIPALMKAWLRIFHAVKTPDDRPSAIKVYSQIHTSFVSIHPFCDGNGRMARLLANIPVLRGGFPPIVIDSECRREYIGLLAEIQQKHPFPDLNLEYPEMEHFLSSSWDKTFSFVEKAHEVQQKRNEEKSRPLAF